MPRLVASFGGENNYYATAVIIADFIFPRLSIRTKSELCNQLTH